LHQKRIRHAKVSTPKGLNMSRSYNKQVLKGRGAVTVRAAGVDEGFPCFDAKLQQQTAMNACPPMKPTDALLCAADATLRTLFSKPQAARAYARAKNAATQAPLSESERAASGALMRVNHVGEVCAQALYTAQALAARSRPGDGDGSQEALAQQLEAAGREETDHLAWTQQRLEELGARPSLLNPLWYAGAFGIGLLAGRLGTGVSLGFVVETERQVEAHLASHMGRLPGGDLTSRAIVAHMMDDEARHAIEAQQAGAVELPAPVRAVMKLAAKVMTTVSHRI
jgi:ubiquinone biosynthesis monooxygenase Coq7